jgi:hypothetical protein
MSRNVPRHGSITLLGSGEVYNSTFLNIQPYESINVIINTDVDGTLFVEYSTDGVNVDFTKEEAIDDAKLGGTFSCFKVISRFARIRFVNGTSPQTVFRLQITLKEGSSGFASSDTAAGGAPDGIIDEGNSTTTPLGISETFTGVFIETTLYSSMTVNYKGDGSGILRIEFSPDGITATKTKRVLQVLGGRGSNHTLAIISKYMRISFDNDAVAQTELNIQCILHKFKSKNLTTTSDRSIGPQTDVQMSRIANNLEVDILLNRVSDQSKNFIFGNNPNIGTTAEDVWAVGGKYNWLAAATTLEILTLDAADDAVGLGAQVVAILGLDANFDEITELVPLTGAGVSVATTNTFIRVNRCVVVQAGTLRGANFNALSIRASGGGVNVAFIGGQGTTGTADWGYGITQLGLFTIPRAKDFIVEDLTINVSGGKNVNIRAYGLTSPTTLGSAKTLLFRLDEFGGTFRAGKQEFDRIAPMTDIWFEGFTSVSNSAVDIRLYYKLVDVPTF